MLKINPKNAWRTCATAASLMVPAAASAAAATGQGMGGIINSAIRDTACAAGFCYAPGKSRTCVQILGLYTNGIIGFLGLIFLVLIIWGGFKWMTAQGNEEQVSKAKKVIINAALGLAIVLLARIITTLFINIVVPAATP